MKTLANVLLLTAGAWVISVPAALAEEVKIELKASTTMKELLTGLTGKRVAVRLDSGEQVEGTVTSVGNSLAHISKLSGKEYYDAVVSMEKVSAIIVRAR